MRRAAALTAALLLAGVAGGRVVAQDTDAPLPHADIKTMRLTFTEAAFGWCAKQVAGYGLVPTALDPAGPGWAPFEPGKGKKGSTARIHTATGVIVELKPDKTSCFVQIDAGGADVLAAALRKLLTLPPVNGVLVKDQLAPEGRGTTYAVRHGKDGPIAAFSINDYKNQPRLLTALVARDPDPKP